MKNWLDHRKVHKTVDIDIKEDTVSRFLTAINHKPVRTTFTILWDPSLVSFMASAFCCTLSMTCPRRGVVATRLRCTRCLLWPPWRLCEPRGNSEARRARLGSQKELRHSGDLQDGGCSFLNPNQLIWGGVISIWIIRCIENRELYSRTRSFAFDEDHAHFLCFTAAKIHGPCQSIQRIEIQTASCKLHTNMPESLDFAYMDLDMSQKSTKPKSHRQSWFS